MRDLKFGTAWHGVAGQGGARQGEAGQMKIEIAKIVIDPSLYPRSGVSELNVGRMLHALETGAKFPPITLEANTHRLIDGRHRYEMFKRAGQKTIEAIEKVYKNEGDLFADAVRLNVGHGLPLDLYSVRTAIIRLTTYGYSKKAISEVVRLPPEQLAKIERNFASDESGHPIALKGGLAHLRGQTLDEHQLAINDRYSGPKAIFHLRQIAAVLANDMYPQTPAFTKEMDDLCALWSNIKQKKKPAA